MLKKLRRLFLLRFVCSWKGHTSDGVTTHWNGFKKGTSQTHNPISIYQKKCNRCNRFYGEKDEIKHIDRKKSNNWK